ncbi:MAG TPA: hypothetical protein VGN63_13525 [Flavisolibacter sp.]|jgi:hypothetical protein|nr:hypothetical protein [Flavisolibacter sp.]
MKKIGTRLLYVFSFSLLFTALYLNFSPQEKENSFQTEKNLSPAALTGSNAVATPENTVLK